MFISKVITIKFYHQELEKRDVFSSLDHFRETNEHCEQ